jgi:hypothetical protein
MTGAVSALAIALLVALLVIDEIAEYPGGRSQDGPGGRQGRFNRRKPGHPGSSEVANRSCQRIG